MDETDSVTRLKARLTEKLAASLTMAIPAGTPRRVWGPVVLPGKATAVVERHQVTNVVGLRWPVRPLLGNAAAMFSVEKFFAAMKSQGVSISKDTVHQLLAHLEDCFWCTRCGWSRRPNGSGW